MGTVYNGPVKRRRRATCIDRYVIYPRLLMNVATQLSRDAGTPRASQTGIISEHILSSSSCGNKLGISPELRMELMSSSIDSSTTCVSVNKTRHFRRPRPS